MAHSGPVVLSKVEERKGLLSDTFPWFAVQVRTRWEANTAGLLSNKGYQTFVPTYSSKRRWSDRTRTLQLPLFPGYLFCRFDPQKRLPILVTPGVIQVVGISKTPVPVEDSEIAAVEAIVRSGLPAHPWPFLQIGERVRIHHRSLEGLEGILLNVKGSHRIVVSVTLLQRSVAMEIDSAWVTPVRSSFRPVAGLGRQFVPEKGIA